MLILYQMNRRRFLNPESCTVLISIVFSPTVFLSVRGAMSRCVCVCVWARWQAYLCASGGQHSEVPLSDGPLVTGLHHTDVPARFDLEWHSTRMHLWVPLAYLHNRRLLAQLLVGFVSVCALYFIFSRCLLFCFLVFLASHPFCMSRYNFDFTLQEFCFSIFMSFHVKMKNIALPDIQYITWMDKLCCIYYERL